MFVHMLVLTTKSTTKACCRMAPLNTSACSVGSACVCAHVGFNYNVHHKGLLKDGPFEHTACNDMSEIFCARSIMGANVQTQ